MINGIYNDMLILFYHWASGSGMVGAVQGGVVGHIAY